MTDGARPAKAYPVICLFYGFFFTQIVAVNAMGWAMFFKRDPLFLTRDLVVFMVLALLAAALMLGFASRRRRVTSS